MALGKKLFKGGAVAAFDPLQNFETVTYTGNGSTQKITGYIRKGAAFGSSTTSQITLPNSIDSDLTASVSFWFKLSEVQSTYGTFLFYFTRNGWGFNAYVAPDRTLTLQACRQSDSTVISYTSSASYVVLGDWYHICITRSSNEAKYYINGSLVETDSYDGTRKTNNYPNSIGNFNSSLYETRGVIDQFRVFNKALSSSEVTTLYGETYASSTKSTTDIFGDGSGVALYELDEDANDTGAAIDSGQSAFFDATNYIDTGIDLDTYDEVWSISFWYKTDSANDSMFGTWDSANWNGVVFDIDPSGQLRLTTRNTNTVLQVLTSSNAGWNDGNWHYVTVIRNASTTYIYGDGVQVASGATQTGFNHALNLSIGRGNPNSSFSGSIDDFRVYDDELTSTEVGYLYSNDTGNIPTDNLIVYYKLDGNATDEQSTSNGTWSGTESYSDPAGIYYNGTPTNVNFLGMAFQPDLVWIKGRSLASNHALFDVIRGNTKRLESDNANAESTYAYFNSFDTNGFTVGNQAAVNQSSSTYVAWCWKGGGAAVSNTNGSITSQVSANPDAGFSIVKYNGTGNVATIGHGLSQAPDLIITKGRDSATNWNVYASPIGATKGLFLNSTDAAATSIYYWNDTEPTSSVFTAYTDGGNENTIAYCFHSVDGYQKVGSYTGTGSSGNTVTTGFDPRFILFKNTNASAQWWIHDYVRGDDKRLFAEVSNAESTSSSLTTTTTGFTLNDANSNLNASGNNYIYLAIA